MSKEGWTQEHKAIDINTFDNQQSPNASPATVSREGFSKMTSQEIWKLNQQLLEKQRPAEVKIQKKMDQAKMAFRAVFIKGQQDDQKRVAELKKPPKMSKKGKVNGNSKSIKNK